MSLLSPRELARRRWFMPWAPIPEGRLVELAGRGTTYVTDSGGPSPDAPAVVLLHALGTTGLLTWYPSIAPLARRYRVVTLDQRWHGRGIQSERFSLHDCADDVAALVEVLGLHDVVVAGYSMGSIVAQRVWRQHPRAIEGLVLCATTDRFRASPQERLFHAGLGLAMAGARGVSRSRSASRATQAAARLPHASHEDIQDWAVDEWRSTSPWAVGQAVAALGRHHSRPWLGSIDVPTAVVVTHRDRVIPRERQLDLARRIRGATVHEIDAGHAACDLEAEVFVPALVEAVATVVARRGDLRR